MEASKKNMVCFGGGTGMPALLRGLKYNPYLDITAIVNMFDSGGSSGDLRDRFGILPPGDILKCVLALAEDERGARAILQKRIKNHQYDGHTSGNLLLLALEQVYGDYESAIDILGQILSITGRVLPVTTSQSTLCALHTDGKVTREEVSVDEEMLGGNMIAELSLDPSVVATRRSLEAIKSADVICIGPGSFYTSVLSTLLPGGIKESISSSGAKVIFIANLMTEGQGMGAHSLGDIVAELEGYIDRRVDVVIANNKLPSESILESYKKEFKQPLLAEDMNDRRVIAAPLWQDGEIARHESRHLSHLVFSVIGG